VKAVFLLGPTASGKTAAALALAERFPAEIISVDSAQVYRGMDVGTAKPDAAERARVPHHLIDIVDPTDAFSAGRFRDAVMKLVPEISARGRLPILAGGTMLYFRALTRGLSDLPVADPEVRAALEAEAARVGWPAMHARLSEVDPVIAQRLKPTDAQRIQRALEVHQVSGEPLSTLQARGAPPPLPFETLQLSLEPSDRGVLHERIAVRFRAMLANGLVEELVALRARHDLHAGLPAMRSVGYRQAWEVLEGSAPRETLEERGIAATRQLAKRQITWLRSMDGLERYDPLQGSLDTALADSVERFLVNRPRGT
jgi:tRNA dimethylallyltransferase